MSVDPRFAVTVIGSPRAIVAPLPSPRGVVALHDAKRAAVAPLRAPRLAVAHPTLSIRDPSTLPEAEPLNVPTIAALRQITGVLNGTVSMVGGRDGGIFVYDSARANEDNGGTVQKGHVRVFSGPADATWFGAKGDGTADDSAALLAACVASSHVRVAGPTRIASDTSIPAGVTLHFDVPGASLVVDSGKTVTLNHEYRAGLTQVFAGAGDVRLAYRNRGEIHPEHFGAIALSDPRTGTEDSTAALQKMFRSVKGNSIPQYSTLSYDSATFRFNGIYGVSDEILVPSGAHTIIGNGPCFTGSGLKWVGTVTTANATKSLLRLLGPQYAYVEGLVGIGAPTSDATKRLYAIFAVQTSGSVPSPFFSEHARNTTFHRCVAGDEVGVFNLGGAPHAQHGFVVDGTNANGDFGCFDNCAAIRTDYGFTITNQQNVYWTLRNCKAGFVGSGLWAKSGTEIHLADSFYVYGIQGGVWIVVGDPVINAAQGAPNVRIVATNIGGEGNDLASGFFENRGGFTATLRLVLNGCEIFGGNGSGMPFFREGTGLSDCGVILSARGCHMAWTFHATTDSPGLRHVLNLEGLVEAESLYVQNDCAYTTIDLDVRGCWAGWFSPTPSVFGNAGRFLGPINFRRCIGGIARTSLGDASLYGVTAALANEFLLGDEGFGFTSRLVSKSYDLRTTAAIPQTIPIIPAEADVRRCKVSIQSGNYLANSNDSLARIFVGDSTDYARFATLSGNAGFLVAVTNPAFTSFIAPTAQNVEIRGGRVLTGTFAWGGNTVTAPSAQFTAAMVGNKIRLGSTEGTITAYVDTTHVTMDTSASVSGPAVMFIPFAIDGNGNGQHITVGIRYDLGLSAVTWQNAAYATPIVSTT